MNKRDVVAAVAIGMAALAAGCTRDNPEVCMTADECAQGLACNLETNTCVAAQLTFDPADFVVEDDSRWWSSVSGPVISGTVDDPNQPTIQLMVNGAPVGDPAVIDGLRWSAQLPEGTLSPEGTLVTAQLVAPGKTIEAVQGFALDDAGPTITVVDTGLYDERADAISYVSGEPIHTRTGDKVVLGGDDCPDVYMHSYLLGETAPVFGRDAVGSENPLRLIFSLADISGADEGTAEYRVITGVGDIEDNVELDWTPVTEFAIGEDGNPQAIIQLYKDGELGIPWLATGNSEIRVEFRATDTGGYESSNVVCWTHHALAAPLQFGAAAVSQGTDAVGSWSLLANSPVSRIMTAAGVGGRLVEQTFVQHTAEPVWVSFEIAVPNISYTKYAVHDIIVEPNSSLEVTCSITCIGGAPASCVNRDFNRPECATPPGDPSDPTATGTLGASSVSRHISELRNGTWVPVSGCMETSATVSCPIPGRSTDGAARTFRAHVQLEAAPELRPTTASTVAELSYLGSTYTGSPLTFSLGCADFETVNDLELHLKFKYCKVSRKYGHLYAIDQLKLNSAAIQFTPRFAISEDGYSQNGAAHSTPFVWDSGNDDLPGTAH